MAFRKKWPRMLELEPDILVLQECEQEVKYSPAQRIPDYNEFIWIGENPNKGVGIISFNEFHLSVSDKYDDRFKYIIPIQVTGPLSFTLFAIWAMPDEEQKDNSYVRQIWNALQHYEKELFDPAILIGDWNSNAIWDGKRKQGNHTQVMEQLRSYGMCSVYHTLRQEEQGKELEPTLYLLKQRHKPYHLDQCCVSKELLTSETSIQVGAHDDWIGLSDHMPIVIDGLG